MLCSCLTALLFLGFVSAIRAFQISLSVSHKHSHAHTQANTRACFYVGNLLDHKSEHINCQIFSAIDLVELQTLLNPVHTGC